MSAPAANAVEEPQWRLVYADGPFAIRDYAPTVVAETRVSGERASAINQGFRRLARFIFGGNERNREIAMTAPVAQAASGEGWIVTFYMPPGSQLADMPRPLDDTVALREQAARRVAVLQFNGLATRENLDRHAAELRARIEARGETVDGEVSYAFYDPPWTLPWARRNEVMIALQR